MNDLKKKQAVISCCVLTIIAILGAYIIANIGTPTSNSNANICAGISVHALSANEAQLISDSGARWIRIDVFEGFETSITNAKAYNLSVLGILGSWMFNKQTVFTLEEWRNNVTYYVSQYSDYVDAWEIYNEPANPKYPIAPEEYNSTEEMSGVVEFYFSMVKIASPIIREHDPTAKIVLLGGLNLWSGGDPHFTLDKEFAQQLAAKNITQYGDAISVHAYPWSTKVESSIWQKYDEALAYYSELCPLEIWVTETGHPVEFEGESGQAQYMSDSLKYFERKVTVLFWYSLVDNDWEENGFGLIDNEIPRLAYYEMQNKLIGK